MVEHEGQQMIDARALHGWLGNKTPYTDWIRRRVDEYGFQAPTDFHAILRKTGGRPKTDHFLTIGMAKELAMVERTSIGQMTRRYFIQMEKRIGPSLRMRVLLSS